MCMLTDQRGQGGEQRASAAAAQQADGEALKASSLDEIMEAEVSCAGAF